MDEILQRQVETILTTLLTASDMAGVKAWAIAVAFRFALERDRTSNPTDVWKMIQNIYQRRLRDGFPAQEDPGQSFRRASGDAFEAFVGDYPNKSALLQKEGIRAVRLSGGDFNQFVGSLGLTLRPKDVDMFLQGIGKDGMPRIFGAVFPKVSYAERIRADEGASRALRGKGLWSVTVTMDARGELGTEERPSVKRNTINRSGFDACYSFNRETASGGRIYTVNIHNDTMRGNSLIGGVVGAWRNFASKGR